MSIDFTKMSQEDAGAIMGAFRDNYREKRQEEAAEGTTFGVLAVPGAFDKDR